MALRKTCCYSYADASHLGIFLSSTADHVFSFKLMELECPVNPETIAMDQLTK